MSEIIWQFFVAAGLALIAALVHGIAGERTNVQHLMASSVPENEKVELRATWHIGTVLFIITAIRLVGLGIAPIYETMISAPVAVLGLETTPQFIIMIYTFAALAWFIVALAHGYQYLLKTPQWVLLMLISFFTWWGLQ